MKLTAIVRSCAGRLRRCFVAAALMSFSGLPFVSAAQADGALEWGKGGMFANIVNPRPKPRLPEKISRKIKKTNVGGIASRTTNRASKRKSTSRKSRRSQRPVRVASLGNAIPSSTASKPTPGRTLTSPPKSITGGARGVTWVAQAGCLNGRLKAAIYHVARNYGRVRVNSTCRSRRHNRRVGGARRSLHLSGNAADIRIWGNVRAAARYLRQVAGGYKHYGGGLFHIDTGPKRSW